MANPSLEGLTQPARDIAVLRAVLNQHWRVLVQDFLTLRNVALTEPDRALHDQTVAIIQALLKSEPRSAVRALRRPIVAGLVGALRRRSAKAVDPDDTAKLLLELDLLVLTDLAASGDVREEIVVGPHECWPVLRSLAARIAIEPPPGSILRFGPGHVSAELNGHRQEILPAPVGMPPAYLEVTPGILFALSDNNPLLAVQGHPERAGNQVDLGGHSVDEWLETLRRAFALIETYQPLIMKEMRLCLELIVPVGYDPERHSSVSYEEAVGAIYMTLHPGVMTIAEALIHEFQHNKLNAVFRWDPILRNAHAPLYTSPVRPDPRPLHGVLLAVHAFQPVARLYEVMTAAGDPLTLGHDWTRRFQQIIDINHEGAETVLKSGQPTAVGTGLLKEIRAIDEYYARYELKPGPPESGSSGGFPAVV
jgi:HEXXH motif-containing protein